MSPPPSDSWSSAGDFDLPGQMDKLFSFEFLSIHFIACCKAKSSAAFSVGMTYWVELDGIENRSPISDVLTPQGILRNPLAIFLVLKGLATNETVFNIFLKKGE